MQKILAEKTTDSFTVRLYAEDNIYLVKAKNKKNNDETEVTMLKFDKNSPLADLKPQAMLDDFVKRNVGR